MKLVKLTQETKQDILNHLLKRCKSFSSSLDFRLSFRLRSLILCKSGFILSLTFLKLCKSGIILILCLFQFSFFFAQCILSTGNLLFTTGDLCFSTRQLLLGVRYLSRRICKFRSCIRSALLSPRQSSLVLHLPAPAFEFQHVRP